MQESEIDYVNFHVAFEYALSDDEDARELFTQFAEVEPPTPFGNRVSVFSEDDTNDLEIWFGKTGEGDPIESATNYVHITIQETDDGDETIYLHADFWYEYLDEISRLLENIIASVGTMEMPMLSVFFRIDTNVPDLLIDLDLGMTDDMEQDFDCTGLRFDYYEEYGGYDDETDILLQKVSEEQDGLISARIARSFGEVSNEEIDGILRGQKEEMRGLLRRISP